MLSDPQKRAKYDQLGTGGSTDRNLDTNTARCGRLSLLYHRWGFRRFKRFQRIFHPVFRRRRRFPGAAPAGAARGQDVESEIELTVEEAYRGPAKSLRLAAETACTACGGSGVTGRSFCSRCGGSGITTREKTLEVRIPKGVRDGSRIRLKGQGNEGRGGAPRGDLYLKVRLRPHPLYRLKGSDIESNLTVRPEQAVLGDRVTVQTLDGPVTMTVPAGSRSGTMLRLKGKGFPAARRAQAPHVRLAIDIRPGSASEKELYRQQCPFQGRRQNMILIGLHRHGAAEENNLLADMEAMQEKINICGEEGE